MDIGGEDDFEPARDDHAQLSSSRRDHDEVDEPDHDRERSGIGGCPDKRPGQRTAESPGTAVTIGQGRLYIDNVGGILAALLACVPQAGSTPNQPPQPALPT